MWFSKINYLEELIINFIRQHADNILDKIPSHRSLALDLFRGLTITGMILVNNPGSWSHIYAPLKHADWIGWTATDLIFPFFLFIVGIAISLSIGKQLANNISRQKIIISSVIRTVKLLCLGWFLSLFYYNFTEPSFNWLDDRFYMMRTMGVLQRIGIVYLLSVLCFIFCKPKTLIIWAVGLLLAYTSAMLFVPYGDADGTIYQGLWLNGNNLAAYIDHSILGINHVYTKSQPFVSDPEGLLSTIPAISTCISGVIVGLYLKQATANSTPLSKQLISLTLIGIIGIFIGEILHSFIPISKALWTASYVILSSGFACLALAFCIFLTDIIKAKRLATPFIVFGANSIAFFMFSGIVGRLLVIIPAYDTSLKAWLYNNLFQPLFGDLNGSLLFAISFLLISYLVMHWMYRKAIFWKV